MYLIRVIAVPCLLALAACNTPGPAFRGIDPVRVTVAQSTFDVRVDGLRAQAIRLNMEWAPRRDAVAPRAVAAIEQVSGCSVSRLDGDQAVTVARLDCGGGAPPAVPDPTSLDCDVVFVGGTEADLICDPIR
ncbi:hypothetical protein [Roseovarius sp.]|jgi:hypothetical protein